MRLIFTAELDGTVAGLGAVATAYENIRAAYNLDETPNPIIPLYDGQTGTIHRVRVQFEKNGITQPQLQATFNTWFSIVSSYASVNMASKEITVQ